MLGVMLGAFGAHALKSHVSAADLTIFETGCRYLLIHAVALFALGLSPISDSRIQKAAWLMVGGIIVFSSTLFLLVLTGMRWWGAITPLGGASLIAAWGSMAYALAKPRTES